MPLFEDGPGKTIIYLRDDTDQSNGLATFLPYPMIEVLPVLPSTLDSIDDYGDWPLELMLHEYAHILNMYPRHGFYTPLSWVFGTLIRPNAILTRWYLEGLAVEMETKFSTHGRLRASETGAMARALTLSGRLKNESLARINEIDIGTWPYGARPYLYGGWWWRSVEKEHGPGVIAKWNQRFARRVPFLLNGPLRDETGKSAHELHLTALDQVEALATRQLKSIESAGLADAAEVAEDESGDQTVFALSPSGDRLIYWLSKPRAGGDARIKTRTAKGQPFSDLKSIRAFKSVGTVGVRWLDEDRLVFDQIDVAAPGVNYRDLYLYDLKLGKIRRLTKGARAQQPAPSPSGREIVFVQNDAGRTHLAKIEISDEGLAKPKVLLQGNLNERFAGPEFVSPNEVLFTWRVKTGEERVHRLNLTDGKTEPLAPSLMSAQGLRKTAKGVLVTDDATEVRNVYLLDGSQSHAVTNSRTQIESADYDVQRDELLISETTADGRRLRAQAGGLTPRRPPLLETDKWEAPQKPRTEAVKFSEKGYHPFRYLVPHYWIPFVYPVENGLLIQGETQNNDPAGRNSYTLLGSYDTVTQKSGYGLGYVNRSLPTDIGGSYSKSQTYLGASDTTLETQFASLNFANYWPFNDRAKRWNLGGVWHQTLSTRPLRQIGPAIGFEDSRLHHPLNSWFGYHAELAHAQYLEQTGYLAYGRSYAHLATAFEVGRGRQILIQGRGALAPKMPFGDIIAVGDRNVGGNYLVNLANSQFLLRGYPSGTFVGRKILSANLEYCFPLYDFSWGPGTFPVFLQNLQGAVFTDFMAVDGRAYETARKAYVRRSLDQGVMGTGAEIRLNTNTAYQLPLSFILGGYFGVNETYSGGFTPFFGIGMGSLGGIENKTP